MKIMYVINYPGSGGAEQYVYTLANYAIKNGHDVSFVYGQNGPLVDKLCLLGCSSYKIVMRTPFDIISICHLTKLFKKIKPDVIHTQFMRENFLVIDASKFFHIPAIFSTVHRVEPKTKIQSIFNKIYSYNLSKFIAVSPLSSDYLLAEGIARDKISVILNGAEIEPFDKEKIKSQYNIPNNCKIITCVGRFTEEKGHGILLKAFSKIPDTNIHLLLVGDGKLLPEMKNLARELDVSSRVSFLGNVNNAYMITGISDFYIQPSLIENMPIAVIEAMLQKIPVIASDCLAHEYLLDEGRRGYLFSNGSEESLKRTIETALKDEKIHVIISNAYNYSLKHLTAESMWSSTEDLYKRYAAIGNKVVK